MEGSVFLIVASAALLGQSAVASLSFLLDPRTREKRAWAIPAFFALIAWFALTNILDQIGLYEGQPIAAGITRGSTFLLPPLAWLFIRTLSTERWRLRPGHGLHLLPAVLIGGIMAVLFTNPPPPVLDEPFNDTAMRAVWLAFIGICGLYLVASLRVLRRDARRIRDFFSFRDNPQRRRQTYILLALMLPWSLLTLETLLTLLIDLPAPLKVGLGLLRLASLFFLCVYAMQPRRLFLEDETGLADTGAAPKYARSAGASPKGSTPSPPVSCAAPAIMSGRFMTGPERVLPRPICKPAMSTARAWTCPSPRSTRPARASRSFIIIRTAWDRWSR